MKTTKEITSVTKVIPKKELDEHKNRAEALRERLSAITVTSEEDSRQVAGYIGEIKIVRDKVKQTQDNYFKPAKAVIAQAKADFDPIIATCDEVERELKAKVSTWMLAEKEKVDNQKQKEIAKVESGYQKADTAVEKIANIKEVDTTVKTAGGTLGMNMIKEVVIVDESLIPEEYYKPRELDMVKINKVAKAGIVIPGIKVKEVPQMKFNKSK